MATSPPDTMMGLPEGAPASESLQAAAAGEPALVVADADALESHRVSLGRRLALGAAVAVTIVLVLLAGVLWLRSGLQVTAGYAPIVVPISLLAALTYAAVGSVIVLRRTEARIGWISVGLGACLAFTYLGFAMTSSVDRITAIPADAGVVAGLLAAGVVSPAAAALAVVFGLIFPTDRLLGPRWIWGVALAVGGAVLAAIGSLTRPGAILFLPGVDNPLGAAGWAPLATVALALGMGLLAVGALTSGAALLVRYRRAAAVMRQQIRLVVAAGMALTASYVVFVGFSLAGIEGPVRDVVSVVMALALLVSPIANLIAIARYRLYDIDRLVGRGFVYGGLLALLAGLYAACMRLFTVLFADLLGESSEIAIVVTTLVMATTLTPIKSRLERIATRWSHEGQVGPNASADLSGLGPVVPLDSGGTAATGPGPAQDAAAAREYVRRVVREVLAEKGRASDPGRAGPDEGPG